MFYIFLSIAIIGMAFLYMVAKMENPSMGLVYVAQFVKSTGVIVATGYMWALVPEVISYGEYVSGKRIAGIVNALTGIFFKAGMSSSASSPLPCCCSPCSSFRSMNSPTRLSTTSTRRLRPAQKNK